MKTFDTLAKEVADMQFGLRSEEDLAALFSDGEPAVVEPQLAEPPTPVVVEPQIPQVPEPQLVTPAPEPQVTPDILETLPEKFKDKDVQGALQKAVKSYTDLESDFRKQTEELDKLRGIVSAVANTPVISSPTTPQPVRQPTSVQRPAANTQGIDLEEVIPDSDFFEKPGEAVTKKTRQEAFKLANEIVAQRILEYHDWNTRQVLIKDFRKDHKDFDSVKNDMITIAQARPDIDQMPPEQSLPILYDLAKERQRLQVETWKKTLGIPEPSVVQPVPPTPVVAQPTISVEQMKAEVLAQIAEEIRKRKAASGITGSSPATTAPQVRATEKPVEKPKTYSEEVFDRMLASGSKHPDDLLGLGTGIKRI